MVTGWDNGLNQDYHRGLGRWFADRLGARYQLTQQFSEKHMLHTETHGAYSVTIDTEAGTGFWEPLTGEEGGKLWLDMVDMSLEDYDGVFALHPDVAEAIRALGYTVDEDCVDEGVRPTPKYLNNVELVTHMMEFSKAGALKQAFIVEAIAAYALVQSNAEPWEPSTSPVNQASWKICAQECLDSINNRS